MRYEPRTGRDGEAYAKKGEHTICENGHLLGTFTLIRPSHLLGAVLIGRRSERRKRGIQLIFPRPETTSFRAPSFVKLAPEHPISNKGEPRHTQCPQRVMSGR